MNRPQLLAPCLFALGSLCSTEIHAARSTAVIDDLRYATAQRRIDVGSGRKMNLYCVGKGSPVVVFDAGLGNWSPLWGLVQPAIAKATMACAYDRAGLGFSDASPNGDGSSATIVNDLHTLLAAASVRPPYVLVGHSYGGMSMRLFADKYLEEVHGLVLVDPSTRDLAPPRDQWPPERVAQKQQDNEKAEAHAKECIAAAEAGFVKNTDAYRDCVSDAPNPRYVPPIDAVYQRLQLTPNFWKARRKEELAIDGASVDQLRGAARSYGSLPLIVLTQSDAAGPDPSKSGFVKSHQRMAALSNVGSERIVPDSSHTIPMDQPTAVIQAIEEVLRQARAP